MYELVIYALLGFLILWDFKANKIRDKKPEWIIYALIAVFFGIRFSLGPDTAVYCRVFNIVENPIQEAMTSHVERNILYSFLSLFCKRAFGEFRWLVLVQNVLILGGCSFIIYKHSKNKLMSLLLFIGSGMLEVFYGSGVRQALAMTIYFVGFYCFLPQKKILRYELCCLLAFGFQEIALVAAVVPFVYLMVGLFKKKPVVFIIVTFLLALSLTMFVKTKLYDWSWHITETYGTAPVWTHVIAYLRFHNFSVLGFGMECVFGVILWMLYFFSDRSKHNDFTIFSILVFWFSVLFYVAFAMYDLMSRVTDFLQIVQLVVIPVLIESTPDLRKKTLAFLAVFALNGFLLYVDSTVNLRRISEQFGHEYTLMEYPYVTVFDTEGVKYYQKILEEQ